MGYFKVDPDTVAQVLRKLKQRPVRVKEDKSPEREAIGVPCFTNEQQAEMNRRIEKRKKNHNHTPEAH